MKQNKIYYQGIQGAYGREVANKILNITKIQNLNYKITPVETFDQIFENIKNNDLGIIPIENSYAGNVQNNFFPFTQKNIKILAEYYLPIQHVLAAKSCFKKIKKVYSHPQALSQCKKFLKENKLQSINFSNTAQSAKLISQKNDDDVACICSQNAAKLYGLKILKKSINDQKKNSTRFLIISKNPELQKIFLQNIYSKPKTTIIFETKDKPGSLYKCLGAFATNQINLSKITSIPSFKKKFHYLFRIDAETKTNTKNRNLAVEELNFFAENIKILGEYYKLK